MVFGLFSKERKLQGLIKKATNKLAQSPERWAAMEKLRDDGSEEALYNLLRRFSFSYDKTIEDEQEKEWVVETMVTKGAAALPPLRRYMKSATTVAYPLRILERVATREQTLEVIDELLADEDPGYTRDTTKRIQILHWLQGWKSGDAAEVVKRVVPYLQDFDENTRFAAVEALSQHATAEAAGPLVAALVNPEEQSGRLKVRIAELLVDSDLGLGGDGKQDAVQPLLAGVLADFRLNGNKLARKSN